MSQQINLFNPQFLTKQKYFSNKTMLQALGILVLGAGLMFAYAQYKVIKLAGQLDEAQKQYSAAQVKFAYYENALTPKPTNEEMAAELQQLETKISSDAEVIHALKSGVMGNTEGYSEYMRAFARQTVTGLWLTNFEIEQDGTQISLSGAVISPQLVPAYIRRLNKEKIMRGKTFATLQMSQSKPAGNGKNFVEFKMQSSKTRVVASENTTSAPSLVDLTSQPQRK